MPPVCVQQVLSAFKLLGTDRGKEKLKAVRENSDYFREGMSNTTESFFSKFIYDFFVIVHYDACDACGRTPRKNSTRKNGKKS